jgi:hypothetical protein
MKRLVVFLLSALILTQFSSCKKDKSFEAPPPGHGSLLNLAGDCMNKVVKGTYMVNKALTDSNYIQVAVRVTQKGSYNIASTNVLNGYSFAGSGVFKDTGIVQVKLIGTGVPSAAQTDRFTLLLDSSLCDIEITVVPTSGGNGSCNANVAGSYSTGTALTTSNTATLNHNFATAGTYNVTTDTVNGYSFKKTVVVSTTGNQSVVLDGAGTPGAAQTDLFTVKFGDGGTCNFSVTVTASAALSEYFPLTNNSWWSYDDVLNSPDTITRTSTGAKTILSNTYTRILEKDPTGSLDDSIFYRKSGADYFEYAAVDKYTTGFSFDAFQEGDILFLKSGQPTGATWNSAEFTGTESGIAAKLRYKFNVINADASITIGGRTYNNVYQVSMKPERNLNNAGYAEFNEAWLFYYAKGVGLIYSKYTIGTTTLEEYQLRNWKVF